ncbi:MAG: HypC/HybG/HupF family hydrogenase formation chaperone [bacterium]
MCLAIPGKIKKINSKTVIVEYPSEEREVLRDPEIDVSVGDYVMVQMKVVVSKITEEDAKLALKEWE